jgi:hypothetical protein
LPTVAGALGMQLNFIALFKAAPIMTLLLMFGDAVAVIVTPCATAPGVAALASRLLGADADADLTVAAGFRTAAILRCQAG